jgi:hypothetical protein
LPNLRVSAGCGLDAGGHRRGPGPVADYVQDGGFSDPHNAAVTGKMLLDVTAALRLSLVAEHRRRLMPAAPEGSFFALGYGGNMIWVDPAHDLVVRWLEPGQRDAFARRVLAAVG